MGTTRDVVERFYERFGAKTWTGLSRVSHPNASRLDCLCRSRTPRNHSAARALMKAMPDCHRCNGCPVRASALPRVDCTSPAFEFWTASLGHHLSTRFEWTDPTPQLPGTSPVGVGSDEVWNAPQPRQGPLDAGSLLDP
jgi:hypothetical protein